MIGNQALESPYDISHNLGIEFRWNLATDFIYGAKPMCIDFTKIFAHYGSKWGSKRPVYQALKHFRIQIGGFSSFHARIDEKIQVR